MYYSSAHIRSSFLDGYTYQTVSGLRTGSKHYNRTTRQMGKSASKQSPSPFRFRDLPLEIQDVILELFLPRWSAMLNHDRDCKFQLVLCSHDRHGARPKLELCLRLVDRTMRHQVDDIVASRAEMIYLVEGYR